LWYAALASLRGYYGVAILLWEGSLWLRDASGA
jgi:hypothetical protein